MRASGARDRCETAREIIGFDHRHKGVRDAGNGFPFAGCDDAVGECGGDRLHRRCDVGRTFDRRQGELDRALAARGQDAFDAEPKCCRVAGERSALMR